MVQYRDFQFKLKGLAMVRNAFFSTTNSLCNTYSYLAKCQIMYILLTYTGDLHCHLNCSCSWRSERLFNWTDEHIAITVWRLSKNRLEALSEGPSMTMNTLDTRSLHPNPLLEATCFWLKPQWAFSFNFCIILPALWGRIYDSYFLDGRKENAPKET